MIHLAALHPLVAPPEADHATYQQANIVPFVALVGEAERAGVRTLLLASSTSVWRDAPSGAPARFIDDDTPADEDGPYASSKRECERLLGASRLDGRVVRLARFARDGADEDEVRKLYRGIDPRDAATLIVAALERGVRGVAYAASAPSPFTEEDAALLASDAPAAILARTGARPRWCPSTIRSVVVARRAPTELGWGAAHPSRFLSRSATRTGDHGH